MMQVEQAIKQRRSIRQYTRQLPKDEAIRKVLEAARWAPSGLNNQPWKFKVVKGRVKNGLAKFSECAETIQNAPTAICVFLDNSATYNREKDIMAIGACIQNILLQAQELGLATCWLGEILNKRAEVERYLQIDNDYELMAVVTIGYSDEKAAKSCRKSLKSFCL